jgi:hypothetical protein
MDGSTSPLTKTRNCPSGQFLNGLGFEILIAVTAPARVPAAELDGRNTRQKVVNPNRQFRADTLFILHNANPEVKAPHPSRDCCL